MARGIPQYSSGHIDAAGSENRRRTGLALRTCMVDYLSNGTSAWEILDNISGDTGTTFNWVMHSVGDRTLGSGDNLGDTDLYIRINGTTSQFCVAAYQDWSTNGSGSGSRDTGNQICWGDDTSAIDWWCVVNEYYFCFIFKLGTGSWYMMHGGSLIRPFIPQMAGVARLTAAITGSGTQTISVDRDLTTSLRVGQKVWLLNQTPPPLGTALVTANTELVTVSAVTSNSITVVSVVNSSYAIGSLVGLDPALCFVSIGTWATATYMTNARDGTNPGSAVMGATSALFTFTETEEDPSTVDNAFAMLPIQVTMTSPPSGFRGVMDDAIRICAHGLQGDLDIMRVNYDDAQKYKFFLTTVGSADWAVCIGPGAS